MSAKCPCKGDYLEKFIQPAILLLLHEGPAHGFKLLTEITSRGFVRSIDAAGFYRTLKQLEEGGHVSSEWDLAQSSRARRVYSVTQSGRGCLANWRRTLGAYQKNIGEIISEIDRTLGDLG